MTGVVCAKCGADGLHACTGVPIEPWTAAQKLSLHRVLHEMADRESAQLDALAGAAEPLTPAEIHTAVTIVEVDLLRTVFEAGRRVLRYDGVDVSRVRRAVSELRTAVDAVRDFDEA